VTTAPRLNVVFYKTGGGILTSALVGSVVSEGEYAFVSKDLATVPTGTVVIGLNLQYGGTVAGKVYLDDALIEDSALTDPIAVPAADLDRAVYVAVAGTRDAAETDILAGVAQQVVIQRPTVSTAQLSDAIIELRDTIAAKRPARQADLARDSALLMSRLLTRVVPVLTNPILRAAAREYTRAFLNSYRRGTSSLRQVAPIDLQFDRFGEVERFRRETWQRLHDQARTRPAVAQAIDSGPIGAALGVRTTQDATTALGLVELEPLRAFVAARTQPGGGILVTRADIHGTLASIGSTMTGLTRSYAANLVALNDVQQDPDGEAPSHIPGDSRTAFEKAIEEAEAKQKDLDARCAVICRRPAR
jgi:hypothetical protein